MTAVSTTTFDERALESLPEGAGFMASCARNALERFESMPVPSQETEEWRYTDLSAFELDFHRIVEGGVVRELDDVPGHLLAAAGDRWRARAGLQVQRNSTTMIAHPIRRIRPWGPVRAASTPP